MLCTDMVCIANRLLFKLVCIAEMLLLTTAADFECSICFGANVVCIAEQICQKPMRAAELFLYGT